MATTTNYSWSTPDDTALVKDGAAAIRTLGSSADTTVKALNPGTTAGDLDYYTTSTAKARVGIGTAGQVLSVNSGATAPEWKTISSGLAFIQRSTFSNVAGTSTTFDGVFTSTYSSYFIEIENLSAATAGDDYQFVFRISGVDGAAHYGNSLENPFNANTWSSTSSSNTSQITIYSPPASATEPFSGQIFVNNIGTSKRANMNGQGFGLSDQRFALFYGVNNVANTYTGFRLKSASTNISGTVAVYGLAQ